MRVYLPIDLAQLTNSEQLDTRIGFAATPNWIERNDLGELDIEDAEEIALYTAADTAWAQEVPIRLAAAAEVPAQQLAELSDGRVELKTPVTWEQVVSLHADTPEMLETCAAARTDAQLADSLGAEALSWFDVTERGLLYGLFAH